MSEKSRDTREKLLDAAQRLFVQNGIDATSLRAVTTAAGANLASVNYHFGSKNGLTHAVFARYLEPLNRERIQLLNEQENRANGRPLSLEAILEAFLAPAFDMMKHEKSREFICLLGRLFAESEDQRQEMFQHFHEVQQRFFSALQRTLPNLPLSELAWRVHFLIGAMAHTFAMPEKISFLTNGQHSPHDDPRAMDRLISFAAAGLKAPVDTGDNR